MQGDIAQVPRPPGVFRRRASFTVLLLATVFSLAVAPRPGVAGEAVAIEPVAVTAELVLRALSLLGVKYRFGGNSPDTGLDCSGLVRHVFREAAGLALPRRSEDISRVGEAVHEARLRPGDLVFFNTLRRAFSHVGIYIGDRRFVHAPASGGSVSIETIDRAYWQRRFNGARRLLALDDSPGDTSGAVASTAASPSPPLPVDSPAPSVAASPPVSVSASPSRPPLAPGGEPSPYQN